jgi:hypothetical protein
MPPSQPQHCFFWFAQLLIGKGKVIQSAEVINVTQRAPRLQVDLLRVREGHHVLRELHQIRCLACNFNDVRCSPSPLWTGESLKKFILQFVFWTTLHILAPGFSPSLSSKV